MLTSASSWENGQTQDCIVARNRFKCNIAMPLLSSCLVAYNPGVIQLLPLLWVNHADLIIFDTYLAAWVSNRVDMQSRSLWLSWELSKPLGQFLLQVICQSILLAEEDHSSLGNWNSIISLELNEYQRWGLTSNCKISKQCIRVRSTQDVLQACVGIFTSNDWRDIKWLESIQSTGQSHV